MQALIKAVIDKLRDDIDILEAETLASQAVYNDLVQEMKAKLVQRVKEFTDGVKI